MGVSGAPHTALAAIGKALSSIRLGIGLIGALVLLAGIGTLIPQGMSGAWYESHEGPALARLILFLRLDVFFRSAVFLAPAGLLTVNLASCAVSRLVRRAAGRAPKRYGPDLVHLGLLALIASGLVTGLGRQEDTLVMVEGDEASIGSGYHVALRSLQFVAYADGSARDWISTVGVTRAGSQEVSVVPIRVNHPLRLPGVTVYQSGWDVIGTLRLRDRSGAAVRPPQPGDWFRMGDSLWIFDGFRHDGPAWSAAFSRYNDRELVERRILRPGDAVGPFTVVAVAAHDRTGLRVVRDPGLVPFLVALLVVSSGICLTFLQRRGDGRS